MKKIIQFAALILIIILTFEGFVLLNERADTHQATVEIEAIPIPTAVMQDETDDETAVSAQATADAQMIAAQATIETLIAQQSVIEDELFLQQQAGKANELAAASHQFRGGTQPDIEQSTLLAVEALRRQNDINIRSALQESLAVLPQLEMEMVAPHPDANDLLFSGDGRFLISTGYSSTDGEYSYNLWDTTDGEFLGKLPVTRYDGIYDWSENGRYLILEGWPDNPYVFDTVTQKSILVLPASPYRLAAAINPSSNLIAYSADIKVESDNDGSYEYTYIFVVQDISTGKEILYETIEPVRERSSASYDKIAFSADGRFVAGADLLRMDIWELATQQIVAQFPIDVSWPEIVLFSPDNTYVAVTGEDSTQVWNLVENKEVLLDNPIYGVVHTLRFSADSQYLIGTKQIGQEFGDGGSYFYGQSGTQVWDMTSGREHLRLLEVDAGSSFIGDTHQLLTINQADTIQIWDVDTQKLLTQSQLNEQVTTTIHPDGSAIAGVNKQGDIRIWSPAPFPTIQTLHPITIWEGGQQALDHVRSLTYLPDGVTLATDGWRNPIRFWHSNTGQEQNHISVPGIIRQVTFNSDGTEIAIGGGNYPRPNPSWEEVGLTTVQEVSGTGYITLTHDVHVEDVLFSPNDDFLATVTNLAQLWDADTGELLITYTHSITPSALAFRSDGEQLVVLSPDKVIVYDVRSGNVLKQFEPYDDSLFWKMSLHPNGRFLAIAESNTIRIWDIDLESVITELSVETTHRQYKPHKLQFSPDGHYLGNLGDSLNIWRVADWQPAMDIPIPALNDFAFSFEDKYLALADQDGLVRVLNLENGQEVNRLYYDGRREQISQVVFRPDNQQLALLGWETVVLWTWNPEDWIDEACLRLGRNFSIDEWYANFEGETYQSTCPGLPTP